MEIRIARWNGVGFKQVSTNWFGYDSPTGDTKILNIVKTIIDDVDEEKELFLINTSLVVPLNTTYYFGIERVLMSIDVDGNPVLDINGDKIYTTTTVETRTAREGVERYVSANIFPKNLPEVPFLSKEVLENGDIKVSCSDVLPIDLVLNQTFWSIYGEDGSMIYSVYRTDEENLRELVIPNRLVLKHNDFRVTVIHGTLDGIMSKSGEIKIDTNKRVNSISSVFSVNSHTDYLYTYSLSNIYDDVEDPIIRIELIESSNQTIIKSFTPTINNAILIEVGTLAPDVAYEIMFFLRPTKESGRVDEETIHFNTASELVKFYTDEQYTYRDKYRFANSANISEMKGKYVEKRPDGRFLGKSDTNEINWFVMDNGNPTVPYEGICPTEFGGEISCYNLHRDFILLVGVDLATGQHRLTFAIDDMYGGEIIFKDTYLFPSIDLRSIEFIHDERYVMFTDLSTNEVKTINIDKIDGESTRRINTITTRPDGIIEKGRMVDVGRNKILMLGGSSDSSYLYDISSKQYMFVYVLPPQFIGVELQSVKRIDGNIVFFPINTMLRDLLIYDVNKATLKVVPMTNFLPDGNGIIKSSGVILRHNNLDTVAYYE